MCWCRPLCRVSFALDKNCWVCRKWLLHSTVTGLASSPFPFRARFEAVTVGCSNHFLHTQQFFPRAKRTLQLQSWLPYFPLSPILSRMQARRKSISARHHMRKTRPHKSYPPAQKVSPTTDDFPGWAWGAPRRPACPCRRAACRAR